MLIANITKHTARGEFQQEKGQQEEFKLSEQGSAIAGTFAKF